MILRREIHSYYVPTGLEDLHGMYNVLAAVVVSRIKQRDDRWMWFVKQAHLSDGSVLNRDLEWEYNSLPSNRDNEELQRTRYTTLDEAMEYVERYIESKAEYRIKEA